MGAADEWEVTWISTQFDLPWPARPDQIAWDEIEWTVRERDPAFNRRSIEWHKRTLRRWHRPVGGFLPLLTEYNWPDRDGRWQRLYADVNDGCHRLLAVRELGLRWFWVSAGNFRILPPIQRPTDRFWLRRGVDRAVHPQFDIERRVWLSWPHAPDTSA